MLDTSVKRYEHIQKKIADAKASDDRRSLKNWRGKLSKWQEAYGAYAPRGYKGYQSEL